MTAECDELVKVSEGVSHFLGALPVSNTRSDYTVNMGKRGDNHIYSGPAVYCSRDRSEYGSHFSMTRPIITDAGRLAIYCVSGSIAQQEGGLNHGLLGCLFASKLVDL